MEKQKKPADLCRMSEDEARDYLESLHWPEGPICPHCGSLRVMALTGKSCRPGLRKCHDCRKQFTVTVGTIFERSHIALRHWVYAITRMCASKKGISAHQLHRELGITYKAAWFMFHRIRHAFKDPDPGATMTGVVEVDETYVGGKPRKHGTAANPINKRGRGTKKVPVLALVQRNGCVRTRVICDVTGHTLKSAIRENVHPTATIMTDEHSGYKGIGADFDGGHRAVNHGQGEYSRPDGTTTNTAESFFSLLKRGVYGTFHRVSKPPLHRYCDEFTFRWDHRKVSDVDRTEAAIKRTGGKRLTYA